MRLIVAQEAYAQAEADFGKVGSRALRAEKPEGPAQMAEAPQCPPENIHPGAVAGVDAGRGRFRWGDLQTMIAAAELYDGIELCRINRARTARAVVAYFAKTARGGQS